MRVLSFAGDRKKVRRVVLTAALAAGFTCVRSLQAQEAPSAPAPQQPTSTAPAARGETFGGIDYTKGSSLLHNPIAQYKAKHVPEPNLSNSPRVDQLMRDGRIMLSMSDAVALALENNLDIAIARYNLPIADTDILRAKAGQGLRGVPTGLVQGTPGGGQGGIGSTAAQGAGPGGTTTGAGGAGA